MGGLQVHNHATSWPNLQEGTCKNSSKVEFQVGPECGKKKERKKEKNVENNCPFMSLPVDA